MRDGDKGNSDVGAGDEPLPSIVREDVVRDELGDVICAVLTAACDDVSSAGPGPVSREVWLSRNGQLCRGRRP